MSTAGPDELRPTCEEIARILLAAPTLDESLGRITASAVRVVRGCDHAAISLVEKRNISTQAPTDDVPALVDAIQYETGQGPSLDAIRDHLTVTVGDLAGESRWAEFAARAAAQTGVSSLLSFRLFVEGDTYGSLNMYSRARKAFDEDATAVGAVLAAHGAVAMKMSREVENLSAAMASRATIEQAKGIVMATMRCTPDRAFEILREQSQALNEKLRDIAAEIVERQARG